MRATVESLGAASHAAAHLTGALDILESTLALLDNVRLKPDATDDCEQIEHAATKRRRSAGGEERCRRARPPRRDAARRAPLPAPRRRRGLRLFRRISWPRHFSQSRTDRCVGDYPRAARRQNADDRPHVGHADRRRYVRLHPRSPGHRDGGSDPPRVGVRLSDSGHPVPASEDARSAVTGIRARRRQTGRSTSCAGRAGAPSFCSRAMRRSARCRRSPRWRSTIRFSSRAPRLARSF